MVTGLNGVQFIEIMRVITKSDDRAGGVRCVFHEYDYRPNWPRRNEVLSINHKIAIPRKEG